MPDDVLLLLSFSADLLLIEVLGLGLRTVILVCDWLSSLLNCEVYEILLSDSLESLLDWAGS